MIRKISFFSLIVLIIASIDNIRNLPSAAIFGPSLIFFFALSALIFLIPTSLMAAELASMFPEKGGIYHWVSMAFGKKWGMVAIWLQWINTMVWYPTILSFVVGGVAYLINPDLMNHKLYFITGTTLLFWGLTWINLKGLHVSARFNNIFGLIGNIIPMLFLIVIAFVWVALGHPTQISLSWGNLIPDLNCSNSWSSLIAIMASFLGVELSGVHVNEIDKPQINFHRALLGAAVFIFLSMTLGSLSIALILPAEKINLVSGVLQVFDYFFESIGWNKATSPVTLLIVIGCIGTMINWLIAPAKGLLQAAQFDFLPPYLKTTNRWGVPSSILITQAALVSLFCLLFLVLPGLNSFYWFLMALSTELYMIMYILMFISGIQLHYKYPNRVGAFKIPGGKYGLWITTGLGLIGCLLTIFISFKPPEHVDLGGSKKYLVMIALGNVITLSPLYLFYRHRKRLTENR